jgi:diguanylate cyclase (GGDEF)-like protein
MLITGMAFYGEEDLPGGPVTVSIGVATYPENGGDKGSLIQAADSALYTAKESGRNKVV